MRHIGQRLERTQKGQFLGSWMRNALITVSSSCTNIPVLSDAPSWRTFLNIFTFILIQTHKLNGGEMQRQGCHEKVVLFIMFNQVTEYPTSPHRSESEPNDKYKVFYFI